MEMSKRLSNLLVLITLIILFCFYYWKGQKHKKAIQEEMQFVNGKILECTIDHRGFESVKYGFFNGKRYFINEQNMTNKTWSRDSFLNKSFPVVFSQKNPEVNEVLIFPKDFEKYGLQYPDSLTWVKKFY